MKKAIVLYGVFLCLCMHFAYAQSSAIQGTLRLKPWTKTIESYCAGGSDYFVIENPPKEDVILQVTDKQMRKMRKLQNTQVAITGEYQKKAQKHTNPMEQHPVGGADCWVLVVKKYKSIK